MAIPEFIADLRAKVGTGPLWLSGVTAVVLRNGPRTGVREVLLVKRGDDGAWTAVAAYAIARASGSRVCVAKIGRLDAENAT